MNLPNRDIDLNINQVELFPIISKSKALTGALLGRKSFLSEIMVAIIADLDFS